MRKSLVIVGGGPVGRLAHDIAVACGMKVRGFLDTHRKAGDSLEGQAVLGHPEDISLVSSLAGDCVFYIGLGKPRDRRKLTRAYRDAGAGLQSLLHPSIVHSATAVIEPGTLISAYVYVHSGSFVGEGSMIESHVAIGTDCSLGSFVTVTQGAMIAARARVGDDAYLGTGAVLLPESRVGARATVGAGAVVTREVAADTTVAGIPARLLARAVAS